MKCATCGEEYQNQSGKCPVCEPCLQVVTREKKTPAEPPVQILPKSVGICPDCGTQQAGSIYRISKAMAEFLNTKQTDTFLPDKHGCAKKIAG